MSAPHDSATKQPEWQQLVEGWAEAARYTPSGGNVQPWRIEASLKDNTLNLLLQLAVHDDGTISPMDTKGFASVMSLGCLSYNLICLAARDGYALTSETFENKNPSHFFETKIWLSFQKTSENPLPSGAYSREVILSRSSNRWPFKRLQNETEMLLKFQDIAKAYPLVSLKIIPEQSLSIFTKLIAKIEALRWTNIFLLNAMVHEIQFKDRTYGLYYKDLGVGFKEYILLWLIQKISWLRRYIRKAVCPMAIRSGYINLVRKNIHQGLIYTDQYKIENGVQLGKCLQQIWLESESHGVAFHVIASPLITLRFWNNEAPGEFNQDDENVIHKVTGEIQQQFAVDLKKPALGFRFGIAKTKTLPAGRRKLPVKFI